MKQLHGVRPSRLNETEVPVLAGPVVAPDWLPDESRKVFDELAPKLAPSAIAAIDAHALGMFAQAIVDYRSALEQVRTAPYVADEHGRPRRHPASRWRPPPGVP